MDFSETFQMWRYILSHSLDSLLFPESKDVFTGFLDQYVQEL